MRCSFTKWFLTKPTALGQARGDVRRRSLPGGASLRWLIGKCYAVLQFSLVFFALTCVGLEQSRANEKRALSKDCQFSIDATRTATAVSGPRSLRLDDGTEVVLEGILPPTRLDHRSVIEGWALPAKASKALLQAAVGRSLELTVRRKSRDRYGRHVAQVHIKATGGRLWLQAYLVEMGHARVAVQEIDDMCQSKALLKRETAARGKHVGLWTEAGYAIKSADKPWALLRSRSTLQIVEGRVKSVAQVRSRVFVNFGSQWKSDFTIGIRRRLAKKLRISGLEIEQLKGREVRIRGWIERRGGPFIQLHSAAQLSLVPSQRLSRGPLDPSRGGTMPTREPKQKRPALPKPDVLDL